MKSLEDLILSTRKNLQSAGISEYLLEAELIWMKALNLDRANLYLEFNESPNARSLECAERLISRRMTREPLAYIIGKIEFFGKEFDIKPGVLIPRQDTETVVEEAIKRHPTVVWPSNDEFVEAIKNRTLDKAHITKFVLYSSEFT